MPDPTGYGRVVRDSAGGVRAIVEQRDADAATLAGRRGRHQRLRLRRRPAARGAGPADAPTTRRARSTSPTSSRCSSPPADRWAPSPSMTTARRPASTTGPSWPRPVPRCATASSTPRCSPASPSPTRRPPGSTPTSCSRPTPSSSRSRSSRARPSYGPARSSARTSQLTDTVVEAGATVARQHRDRRRHRRRAPTVGPYTYLRAGHGARRQVQGRCLRRDQEQPGRRRSPRCRTCPTSATRPSASGPTSARRRSSSTTTGSTSTTRRSATTYGSAATRMLVGAGHDRRRRLHRRRLGDHARTCRPARSPSRAGQQRNVAGWVARRSGRARRSAESAAAGQHSRTAEQTTEAQDPA